MTTIALINLILSITSIIFTALFGLMTLRLRKQVLITQRATYDHSLLSQFNATLINLINIAQDWHLLEMTPQEQRDLLYNRKVGNLKIERASLVETADKLAGKVEDMIAATNFSEFAKSLYSVYEYEKAEKYHLKAIEKSTGALGIACRRSYADFLFCIGKTQKGRQEYDNCLIDEDTDSNKEQNARTLKMWMYNEAQLGNFDPDAIEKYMRAKNLASQISILQKRKDLLLEIENEKNQLWKNFPS